MICRKNSEGTWTARVSLGFDAVTGRRIQRRVAKPTKRDCEVAVASLRTGNLRSNEGSMTVREFFHQVYLPERVAKGIKPRSINIYTLAFDKRVDPVLGGIRMDKFSPVQAQQFANHLTSKYATTTAENTMIMLKSMLSLAVDLGMITSNPAKRIVISGKPKETEPWTAAEAAAFLTTCKGSQYESLFWMLLETGMRIGEALTLRWDDIDFDSGRIVIQRTRTTDERGSKTVGTPKGGVSRVVPMSPALAALLSVEPSRSGNGWVYPGHPPIKPVTTQPVREIFQRLIRQSGVRPLSFHGLRHTSASILVSEGVPITTLQQRLGHRSVVTTQIYAKPDDSLSVAASATLASLLGRTLD